MESGCDPNSPECWCPCLCGCQDDPHGYDIPFVNGLCASCAIGNHEVPPGDLSKMIGLLEEILKQYKGRQAERG